MENVRLVPGLVKEEICYSQDMRKYHLEFKLNWAIPNHFQTKYILNCEKTAPENKNKMAVIKY